MTSTPKPVPLAHAEPVRAGNLYRVAIVGAATLKGKEVAEVLNDRNFPSVDVKLLDDDESLGQLETMGEEISFIQSVRAEQFDRVDFTFFASNPECTLKNWKTAQKAGSAIVDLSYALEGETRRTHSLALGRTSTGASMDAATAARSGRGGASRRSRAGAVAACEPRRWLAQTCVRDGF